MDVPIPKVWYTNLLAMLTFMTMFSSTSHAHEGTKHNAIHEVGLRYRLYEKCKDDLEGYTETRSGQDITYHSVRPELQEALICRATDGTMSFSILTEPVPGEKLSGHPVVTFFYYANIGLLLREPFDIFVNGLPLLTFTAREDGSLDILENPGGGDAEFLLLERDQVGDGLGVFRLSVPTSMLNAGQKAVVRLQGHARNSNAWVMFFKAEGVIRWLKEAARHEAAFLVRAANRQLVIDAPRHFAGREVWVEIDGEASKKTVFAVQGDLAKATLQAEIPRSLFRIWYGDDSSEIRIDQQAGPISTAEIQGDFFYTAHVHVRNGWSASISRTYRPTYYPAFNPFLNAGYAKGMISLMNSSHQDIAWVDRPEACIIMRDTLLLTPILEDAFARADYGFDIEDGLILREYLQRHPDARDRISALLEKKLLSVGATYNCPYEDMYDGEDLARQFYLGKKWVKQTFGGYDSRIYWNVDVPGKTLQMPQLLKKAGVDYMVISRHAKGLFHWQSPDGSTVFTYSPGHYGNDVTRLTGDMGTKLRYGAEQFTWWTRYSSAGETTAPLLSSADMLPAIDYTEFIRTWNAFDRIRDHENQTKPVYLPHMELMTMDEFMPIARASAVHADTIRGERPNVWVYIHGPAHHEALTASRNASKLLTAAEKFSSAAYILDRQMMPYPASRLDAAWQAKIYPDHGWGGHDGDITDNLFRENLVRSENIGKQLLDESTSFIARRVRARLPGSFPVVVFNSLSWERSDVVSFPVNLPPGYAKQIEIRDAEGNLVPSQLKHVQKHQDGTLRSAECVFVARAIPAIGYATYFLQEADRPPAAGVVAISGDQYENDHYRITFAPGGISEVYDKQFDRQLFDTEAFRAGEVFTMRSVGNGAGEFADVQQPDMAGYDQVSRYGAAWEVIENGPVFTTYRMHQQLDHARIEMDVTCYHALKRIRFDHRLLNWDGTMYREFRTAFPVALENPEVAYEVPFGRVRVGKDEIHSAGERYTPLCRDVRPRAIMDWMSATDAEMAVTLSSSVAAADWIDPTGKSSQAMLQHILLASRTSCHWEGNDYAQHGDHTYACILTSHAKGSLEGIRVSEGFHEPLHVVFNPDQSVSASLPMKQSFFSVDSDHLSVSTVKKAEDAEGLVLRLFDIKGEAGKTSLRTPFPVAGIFRTNLIEENPVRVNALEVLPYGIETFLIDIEHKQPTE